MTFFKWLQNQSERDDMIGDLARDVRLDKTFPKSSSLEKIRNHLESSGACEGAVSALEMAYTEWHPSYLPKSTLHFW
ncbi:YozE family protein [Desulfonema magnum]|uniref:SAM-like domain-containing protein n=1 Tax=Desulfonema magnum TaxID=45655 RepID=A0A975BNQ2_9BACT|nr:YozE family protein [Desulfonema magnum]QTA88836.1 SAM-like domain-containing protein [Desulfonema magnum]